MTMLGFECSNPVGTPVRDPGRNPHPGCHNGAGCMDGRLVPSPDGLKAAAAKQAANILVAANHTAVYRGVDTLPGRLPAQAYVTKM